VLKDHLWSWELKVFKQESWKEEKRSRRALEFGLSKLQSKIKKKGFMISLILNKGKSTP
jgi:hypothetical protein